MSLFLDWWGHPACWLIDVGVGMHTRIFKIEMKETNGESIFRSQICVSYKFILVTKVENQNHMQVEAIYFTEQ